ncbi:MAG: HDOD domain-containing protein [Phycisphaerales bacterium]|nr:HDOD domain-containing protein [Phycisphaerales bacterium]
MKTRNDLTATELASLHEDLDRKLTGAGVETQPAVAGRILELTRDPDAGMSDYAKIIRNDAALSGRLLRLANSAFFAQRKPVTSTDRACVLLGLERLRSIALGFYLAKAAATDAAQEISREVWGQSVYRACLAAEVARTVAPGWVPEAFVVGLMLDAGIPLTHKLLGQEFETLYLRRYPPLKFFRHECTEHEFTHVDVMTVLGRRWKFPEMLVKPIEWHHTPPGPLGRQDPMRMLHRVAYYVGAIELGADGKPAQDVPMSTTAETHLGLGGMEIREMVERSSSEYGAVVDLFADVANRIEVSQLANAVHQQLVDVLDEQLADQLAHESCPGPQQFKLGGLNITLRAEDDGLGTAYAYDSLGEPLSTYRFLFATETGVSIRAALGLEPHPGDELEAVTEYLSRLAA